MNSIDSYCDLTLTYCKVNGLQMTHLQLQKVLYYIQGWSLGYYNDSLFKDKPEAWVNGPVYTEVYQTYKEHGDRPIPYEDREEKHLRKTVKSLGLKEEKNTLILEVLEKYATLNPGILVYKTHSEAPWLDAREGLKPYQSSNKKISHKAMRLYFLGRIERMQAKAKSK